MDALINLETKQNIQAMTKTSVSAARNQLCQTCINILAYYRKSVSSGSASAQFVLPESLKTYPLLLLGLMKTPGLGLIEDFKLDAKVANFCQFRSCSFTQLLTKAYPKVYSISQIIDSTQSAGTFIMNESDQSPTTSIYKPINVPCSVDKIVNTDAYLIVNSDFIYVYIPANLAEDIIRDVFGKATLAEIVPEEGIPFIETDANKRVHNIIDHLRKERSGSYQQVKIVLASSTQAPHLLRELLVEDCKNPKKEFAYLQFLTHLHRMILNKASSI
jgi:protein transport protein SEC24